MTSQNFHPVLIDGYTVAGENFYNGIFEQGDIDHHAVRDLTSAEHQAEFDSIVPQGFRPRSVSGYAFDDGARYAAVFGKVGGPQWVARNGMIAETFDRELARFAREGFDLVDVSAHVERGIEVYAALWHVRMDRETVWRRGVSRAVYEILADQ